MRRHEIGTIGSGGFTAIELIIVMAIIAILASIAVPSFADYVRRSRLTEAITRLSDQQVRMEQYFLDNRRYDDGAGHCGYPVPPATDANAFSLDCIADEATYTVTARGLAAKSMQDFVFSIDQANARKTASVPTGWTLNDSCWVVRRDGSCV